MKREFDLLKSYKEYKRSRHRLTRRARRNLIAAVLVLFISAGIIFWLMQDNAALRETIAEQNAYLNDSENLRKVAEVTKKDEQILLLTSLYEQVSELKRTADHYPQFDQALIELLDQDGYTLTAIQYNRGMLTIELTCKKAEQPSAYVRLLKATDLFSSVEYNGFSDDPVQYSFTVVAQVKTGEDE